MFVDIANTLIVYKLRRIRSSSVDVHEPGASVGIRVAPGRVARGGRSGVGLKVALGVSVTVADGGLGVYVGDGVALGVRVGVALAECTMGAADGGGGGAAGMPLYSIAPMSHMPTSSTRRF